MVSTNSGRHQNQDADRFSSISSEHLMAAQRVIANLKRTSDLSFAAISGSLAFGLGHAASDIDLYVMTLDGTDIAKHHFNESGFEVHVTVVSREDLQKVIEWSQDSSLSPSNRRTFVSREVRKLAARLTGCRIIEAQAAVLECLQEINQSGMRRQTLSYEAIAAGVALEDAYGAACINDFDTAFMAVRIALENACSAVLASCDDLYIGQKFLIRRIKRTHELRSVQYELARALDMPTETQLTSSCSRVSSMADLINYRAGLASYLISSAILCAWEVPSRGYEPYDPRSIGPRRDPFHVLNRFADGIGLAGPDRGFRVTEPAAKLWLELDGSKPMEVIRSTYSREAVRGIKKLVDVGAVIEQ